MLRFATLNAARFAMVLMVIGTWASMAGIAKVIMKPVYDSGLISLRTASRSRRKSKMSKVVATPWVYTMVFVLMLTSFTGMGILMKDTSDFFGFQKHILSWEYIIHPKYAALMCVCAIASSSAAVATFRKQTRNSPVSPDKYDKAWKVGFYAFMGLGVLGLAFFLLMESYDGPEVTMPGGESVAKGIALIMATRSHVSMMTGESKARAQKTVNENLDKFGLSGDKFDQIRTFAHTLPNRMDDTSRVIEQRMIARGFDAKTAALTRREFGRVRKAALASYGFSGAESGKRP